MDENLNVNCSSQDSNLRNMNFILRTLLAKPFIPHSIISGYCSYSPIPNEEADQEAMILFANHTYIEFVTDTGSKIRITLPTIYDDQQCLMNMSMFQVLESEFNGTLLELQFQQQYFTDHFSGKGFLRFRGQSKTYTIVADDYGSFIKIL